MKKWNQSLNTHIKARQQQKSITPVLVWSGETGQSLKLIGQIFYLHSWVPGSEKKKPVSKIKLRKASDFEFWPSHMFIHHTHTHTSMHIHRFKTYMKVKISISSGLAFLQRKKAPRSTGWHMALFSDSQSRTNHYFNAPPSLNVTQSLRSITEHRDIIPILLGISE